MLIGTICFFIVLVFFIMPFSARILQQNLGSICTNTISKKVVSHRTAQLVLVLEKIRDNVRLSLVRILLPLFSDFAL